MLRKTAVILLLLLAAGRTFAADDTPRFLIERIDVRNTRHASPAIIIAETRLKTGQSYSEADLREASYRVARLPFVLDAQYALEKGSRRDAYVFVITVSETKPLFFDAQLDASLGEDNYYGTSDLLVGARMFAGSRGVFHGAVGTIRPIGRDTGGDARTVQAGYTQYDLFGTRAFATVDVTRRFDRNYGNSAPTVSLLLGIPVGANQTLSIRGLHGSAEYAARTYEGQHYRAEVENNVAALTWSYDTTNSPFFPTRGSILSIYGDRGRYETRGLAFAPESEERTEQSAIGFNAARYWELSERNSISARFDGAITRSKYVTTSNNPYIPLSRKAVGNHETLTVNFSHSFFDLKTTRSLGDSRLEAMAGLGGSSYDYGIFQRDHGMSPIAGVWWSRRTAWGLFRIGASYQW